MLTDKQIERYARHILLPDVGGVGQGRLFAAEVAVDGLEPAGAWAAHYLTLAGVGALRLRDPRPIPAGGLLPLLPPGEGSRAEAAAKALAAFNPDVGLNGDLAGEVRQGESLIQVSSGEEEGALWCKAGRGGGRLGWVEGAPCVACAAEVGGEPSQALAALMGSLAASAVLRWILFGEREGGLSHVEAGSQESVSCPHR